MRAAMGCFGGYYTASNMQMVRAEDSDHFDLLESSRCVGDSSCIGWLSPPYSLSPLLSW